MATKKTKRRKINWEAINEKIEKGGKKNFQEDNGYSEFEFKPHIKEDGTHDSLIRFLPRPENDKDQVPYVKLFNHGFKNAAGQWFIENCPTTLNKDCPVCKENSQAWNSGDKDTARDRKRKESFYCNILVIKDPQTPENNGKVFIWRFGKKVMEKVMAKMSPDGDIDEPVEVFDYDNGMNFKLKIKTSQFRNYDACEFTGVVVAIGDDDYINKIDNELHTLDPIVSEDKFKDFDTLKSVFDKKTGKATVNTPIPERRLEATADESIGDEGDEGEESIADIFKDLEDEA